MKSPLPHPLNMHLRGDRSAGWTLLLAELMETSIQELRQSESIKHKEKSNISHVSAIHCPQRPLHSGPMFSTIILLTIISIHSLVSYIV